MPYRTVLFDLDHTLLDSDASADRAFRAAMDGAGVPVTDGLVERFADINLRLWSLVERGELSPNDVRTVRFVELFEAEGIAADPGSVGDAYVHGLGTFGEFYPGTSGVLDQLGQHATLGLVTNGIGEVQRARIERLGLERWFDAFVISGEVGIAKPDPAIFDRIFTELGNPPRSSTLMVGDSLTSDMAGGAAAGLDTAWFNPTGRSPDGVGVTYQIARLEDVVGLVLDS